MPGGGGTADESGAHLEGGCAIERRPKKIKRERAYIVTMRTCIVLFLYNEVNE